MDDYTTSGALAGGVTSINDRMTRGNMKTATLAFGIVLKIFTLGCDHESR